MITYTLGQVNRSDKTIAIVGSDGSVEYVALSNASSRIKELRAQAAAPLFTGGQVASCYKRRNVGL